MLGGDSWSSPSVDGFMEIVVKRVVTIYNVNSLSGKRCAVNNFFNFNILCNYLPSSGKKIPLNSKELKVVIIFLSGSKILHSRPCD
jgi:hypothetical protein